MSDEQLFQAVRDIGLQMSPSPSCTPLLAALEAIGRDGAIVVVKFDGKRPNNPFTVVITHGRLRDDFFHKDASDLESVMREGIQFYVEQCRALEARP